MAELSPKKQRFVEEYVKDLNATQAAIRAGYSEKTAYSMGSRLLSNVEVSQAIQLVMDKRSQEVELDAKWIIKRLMRIADIDLAKAYGPDGALLPVPEMPEDVRYALQGVDVHKDFTEGVEVGETKKIKTADKLRALELLGRHMKLFIDKVEHSGSIGWEKAVLDVIEDEKK